MKPIAPLAPLLREQASAADPRAHAWVSASAGTGKTQVLSARVLRLLLAGTPPAGLLCITFTKLAAAEMQERVMQRLAYWARCDHAALMADLAALGAPADADTQRRALRLFADVLEAPQGLAVQTIHAFAQSLIGSFPIEAAVAPGFTTLDDRAAALLRSRVLAEAIEAGDDGFLADLAALSIAGGEGQLAGLVARFARHAEGLAALPTEGFLPMLRRHFGLPADEEPGPAVAAMMETLDWAGLARLGAVAGRAAGANPAALATELAAILAGGEPELRLDRLLRLFFTTKGPPKKTSTLVTNAMDAADDGLRPFVDDMQQALAAIAARRAAHALADHAARHLRVGQRLVTAYARAKHRAGAIDYDDMIVAARGLLAGHRAVEWVRYKLDQRIDHVLVDEAQDTNDSQWQIVRALIEEFFAGAGAREVERRLFAVGDFKQAIYGFQGSDPQVYADKGDDFRQLADDAGQEWRGVPLSRNFRSTAPILDLVDQVVAEIGETVFAPEGVPRHVAHRSGGGTVTLWPPEPHDAGDEEDGDDGEDVAGDSDAAPAPRAEVRLARRVAAAIAAWLDPADPLRLPSNGLPVQPQDILVLVRKRTAFSGALVAALHQHGVPVAGVDRLKLTEPLAVNDLVALVRFALLPDDDLNLAALLVSPFGGFDHDQLTELAAPRRGSLWQALGQATAPHARAAHKLLTEVMDEADRIAPYEFLEHILSGPARGRKRLLARLGEEARDAIDAVLDQALAYEAQGAPTLQGFLAWIDAGDVEIKRDPDAPLDAVRLMTVHGAKGLQAPVVVMADAIHREKQPDRVAMMLFDNTHLLPVICPPGVVPEIVQRQLDVQAADAAREHARLLYVALTRAEDMLFIGGALDSRCKGEVPEGCWYDSVARALAALGAVPAAAPGFEAPALRYSPLPTPPRPATADLVPAGSTMVLPEWAGRAAPAEARPPRPLAPSSLAGDDVPTPPPGPAMRAAARRGTALHALFERLPEVPPGQRRAVGEQWCRMTVPELDAAALVTTALGVLDDPRFAAVFAPGALAEAPIAALVGDQVIAGTVDRLLVTDSHVCVVDFKTGRRVPAGAAAVEPYYLAQMGAYAAALRVIFPGRSVSAALLYSEGPALIDLPDELLQQYHPAARLRADGDPLISPA